MMRGWRAPIADEVVSQQDVWANVSADVTAGPRTPAAMRAPWPPPPPTGATNRVTGRPAVRSKEAHRHWLEIIFQLGLAGVFLANAVVAWVDPSSFVTLAKESGVGRWLRLGHAWWLAPVICVNDLVIGIAVLAGIWSSRAPKRLILAWAGLWLLAVTLLKLTSLDVARSV